MRNRAKFGLTCGVLLLTAGACLAQGDKSTEPAKYFHLDFAVKELDGGKVVKDRHYFATTSTGNDWMCNIRTGNKMPVQTSGTGPDSGTFTYVDVGVNIDCRRIVVLENDIALNVAAEISTAMPGPRQPIIRQTKWDSH